MEHARDNYLVHCTNSKIKHKLKVQFDMAARHLVEIVRKDKEIHKTDITDDVCFVKLILKWLYRAMDQNKKYLAPVLRPYLKIIFSTSHSNGWHIDNIRNACSEHELGALGAFARLVNSGEITPATGLVDAANKNWNWAKSMLETVEEDDLRLVFISDKQRVLKHVLSMPVSTRKNQNCTGHCYNDTKGHSCIRSYFNTIITRCKLYHYSRY